MHVVPAVLARARVQAVNGRDALLAAVLGYEIGARIGIASKLRVAMHPHGTWGTVGAALAVAKLSSASAEDVMQTINVASSLGLTTSRRTMLEGATVRNAYAGFSNMLGLMAWDLVQSGFKGEVDGVGSVYGGIAADDWQPAVMTAELGHRWEIARNYFKRHAACRYNHGALDALAKIVVWAAQLDHPAPSTMLAAKFSMPFSLATFIVQGAASLDAFRDTARNNPATRALAAKIHVDENIAFTQRLPAERPARVTVIFTDGRVMVAEVSTNKGDTEDPYSAAEVQEKFIEVARPVLGEGRAKAVVAAALALESARSVRDIETLCEAA
jgi:2-methylcitrate dehydratase PrpD